MSFVVLLCCCVVVLWGCWIVVLWGCCLSGNRSRPGVFLYPVARYVGTTGDPHPVMLLDVVQKTLQRRKATGPADQARMQAYRQHGGTVASFRIQHIKSVFQVGEELLAGVETLWRGKTHVVGITRIGHHQHGTR